MHIILILRKMNMKKIKSEQMIALNDNLFNEMFLLELETRLETDPLLPSGLLELMNDSEINPMCECYDNSRFVECICYSGSTYVQ